MSNREGRSPGRQSYGERKLLSVRFAVDHRKHVADAATAAGVSEATYVYRIVAEAEGFDEPWWVTDEFNAAERRRRATEEQEELPLARTA